MDSDKINESEDYYLEDGFIVFTRAFHLKRGYCCHSGCRNCPYKDQSKEHILNK
ncbi:MAG TPA: DUF5522 domain-containing protein [Saprospiraceae bacterium]|nr:DUF5522 domain-containing protein [Saprospiraceae bacterium]